MPPAPVDPDRLLFLSAALAPLRECARAGAEEVLGHYPEVGDRQTQGALDDYLEQVADLLREIDASATDLAARLRVAVVDGAAVDRAGADRAVAQSVDRDVAPSVDQDGEVLR